jgi:hypothetical protein
MGYGIDGWDSIPSRGKKFFFSLQHQTYSGIHPAYCSVGTGSISLVVKLLGLMELRQLCFTFTFALSVGLQETYKKTQIQIAD